MTITDRPVQLLYTTTTTCTERGTGFYYYGYSVSVDCGVEEVKAQTEDYSTEDEDCGSDVSTSDLFCTIPSRGEDE